MNFFIRGCSKRPIGNPPWCIAIWFNSAGFSGGKKPESREVWWFGWLFLILLLFLAKIPNAGSINIERIVYIAILKTLARTLGRNLFVENFYWYPHYNNHGFFAELFFRARARDRAICKRPNFRITQPPPIMIL